MKLTPEDIEKLEAFIQRYVDATDVNEVASMYKTQANNLSAGVASLRKIGLPIPKRPTGIARYKAELAEFRAWKAAQKAANTAGTV